MFRQVSEEQREQSEGRYRNVLLEAVQDAVHLSAQNQQLQAENKQLQKGRWIWTHIRVESFEGKCLEKISSYIKLICTFTPLQHWES